MTKNTAQNQKDSSGDKDPLSISDEENSSSTDTAKTPSAISRRPFAIAEDIHGKISESIHTQKSTSVSDIPPPTVISAEQIAALEDLRMEFPEVTAAKFKKAIEWIKANDESAIDEKSTHAPHLDPLEPHRSILLHFRRNNPEKYSALEASDIDMLAKTECLHTILSGKSVNYFNESSNGNITAFPGKPASKKGSLNDICYVAFLSKDWSHFISGVLKTPLKDRKRIMDMMHIKEKDRENPSAIISGETEAKRVFQNELDIARLQHSWKNPHIINPLSTGEDHIIYETSKNAMTLEESLKNLKPEETLSLFLQTREAVETFWRNGMFISDFKPDNILILEQQEPDDNITRTTKLIDLSVNSHKDLVTKGGKIQSTLWYMPPFGTLSNAESRLRAANLSDSEIEKRLAAGFDMHAIITTVRKLLTDSQIIYAIPGLTPENIESLEEYGEQLNEVKRYFHATLILPPGGIPKFPSSLNPALKRLGNIIDMSNDLTLISSENNIEEFWKSLRDLVIQMGGNVPPSEHRELQTDNSEQKATIRPGARKQQTAAEKATVRPGAMKKR